MSNGGRLHRTAVLLTHQEQAAVNLVQVALAKAWWAWSRIDSNPEAYVRRIIINEFASASPRRWHGQQPTAELPERHRDSDSDDADSMSRVLLAALAPLPARQRAVVVLRFFHDYTEAATAEAMGTRIGTVRSRTFDALAALRVTEGLREAAVPDLAAPVRVGDVPLVRTLNDLRSALHDGADAAAYPDVEALVAGARRRVAASRRRRFAVLGAATVAVLVVGGLVMTRPTHQAVPQPAGPGPFTVNTGGADFPEYQQGMKRLIVVDAPMLEQMKGSISVPTTAGRDLALRITCTSTTTEWNARMIAKFTAPGGAVQATCAFRGYVPIGAATDAKTAVKVEVAKNDLEGGALPTPSKDAKIHVAIYESVPWQDYPFPPRPADLETSAQYAWPNEPGTVRVGDVPLVRTLDDLRSALHDGADAAAYPDVEALVAGARRRVAASRRRRFAVLGAATVAVLVVGGLVMTRPTHQAVPQPAGPGPFTVNTGGADFPKYQQGMKRLIVVDAPMLEQMKGSISVPTTAGRDLALRMTCTSTTTEWNAQMMVKFTAAGGAVQATCAFRGYVPIGAATDAKTAVKVEVAKNGLEGALPTPSKDAKIHVAIYESVPWQDYPFPPRPADLETSAQYAWPNEPGTVRVLGPKTAQEANKAVTFTQPFDPKLMVNLQIRGPGRIRVLINGKDVSRQVGTWHPLDKFISSWGYDQEGLAFPLDPLGWASPRTGANGPTTKPGTPVTVTIEPQDFQGPDWRIALEPNRPTEV